jgi:hypothetical protein
MMTVQRAGTLENVHTSHLSRGSNAWWLLAPAAALSVRHVPGVQLGTVLCMHPLGSCCLM